jgi:multimeric flavodoxin WrbA
MDILIISSSSNKDGLTSACGKAALEGILQAGREAEEVRLNNLSIGSCKACDNGWGTCRDEHYCKVLDDFQALHERMLKAVAFVFVTPVYWGDLSESMKNFTDRLRHCETLKGDQSGFSRKPVMMVAAAGESGNGTLTCLANLERWIEHVHAPKWDFIPVNRWSREYKLDTIRAAAEAMTCNPSA